MVDWGQPRHDGSQQGDCAVAGSAAASVNTSTGSKRARRRTFVNWGQPRFKSCPQRLRPHLGLSRAVSTLRPPLGHACASISGSCTPCFVSASARPRSSGGPLRPSAYTTW